MDLRTVAIVGGTMGSDKRLFEAVNEIYPVRFVWVSDPAAVQHDAAIILRASRAEALRYARHGVRCLAFMDGEFCGTASRACDVLFSATSLLDASFRGAKLSDPSLDAVHQLSRDPADEVIAQRGPDVLWLRHRAESCSVDFVAIPPPLLNDSELLFSRFHRGNWCSLLPLLHFLREVSGWTPPAVRACLMFDDPNLHWPSYGYVRYDEIAEDAKHHGYHSSFATVPLDGWYVDPRTSRTFRENQDRLSLLIHGNDHTHFELLQPSAPAARLGLAARALRRVDRIERRTGLRISRVMTAPHGACNAKMATALLQSGFDAACISRGSLMSRNHDVVWPLSVGLRPAEFLGGLPVFPRFNFQSGRETARFAAFLGQAVIPVGHHDDLAGGLGVVRGFAQTVNAMARVSWMDLDAIVHSNYLTRRDGDALTVRMYSRKIRLPVPPGINHVYVDRPWLTGDADERLVLEGSSSPPLVHDSYRGEPLPATSNAVMTVESIYPAMIDLRQVVAARSRPWAILRRQLCEARDRLRPTFDRLVTRAGAPS